MKLDLPLIYRQIYIILSSQCSVPINHEIGAVDSDSLNRSGHSGSSSEARVSEVDILAVSIKNTVDRDVVGGLGTITGQITFSGALPSDLEAITPTKVNLSLSNVASYCTVGASAISGMEGIGAISVVDPVNNGTGYVDFSDAAYVGSGIPKMGPFCVDLVG